MRFPALRNRRERLDLNCFSCQKASTVYWHLAGQYLELHLLLKVEEREAHLPRFDVARTRSWRRL